MRAGPAGTEGAATRGNRNAKTALEVPRLPTSGPPPLPGAAASASPPIERVEGSERPQTREGPAIFCTNLRISEEFVKRLEISLPVASRIPTSLCRGDRRGAMGRFSRVKGCGKKADKSEAPDLEAHFPDGAWYDIVLRAADPTRNRFLVQVYAQPRRAWGRPAMCTCSAVAWRESDTELDPVFVWVLTHDAGMAHVSVVPIVRRRTIPPHRRRATFPMKKSGSKQTGFAISRNPLKICPRSVGCLGFCGSHFPRAPMQN